MDTDALQRLGPALDQFLEDFAGCAVAPTRRLIATYVRGQLGSLPRKSVKPMAMQAGIPPRTLQELLSLHRWDEELLLAMLQRRVRKSGTGPGLALLFESRCVKKGDRTPGVDRQSCESAGRARNCVILQHLAFSRGEFHCLLESAVYLPESWTSDRERCRAAGIPEELGYRSRAQIASDLLRRTESSGLVFDRLVVPPEYLQGEGLVQRGAARLVTAWGAGEMSTEEKRVQRQAFDARRQIEERMAEIGLDHFEVRTYRSLKRHLALSTASVLFLAENGEPQKRLRLPLRSHA